MEVGGGEEGGGEEGGGERLGGSEFSRHVLRAHGCLRTCLLRDPVLVCRGCRAALPGGMLAVHYGRGRPCWRTLQPAPETVTNLATEECGEVVVMEEEVARKHVRVDHLTHLYAPHTKESV